jgi:glycosidase
MQVGMDIDLYKLGIAYFLTTRGIPQIFYGSEILMTHTESNSHGDIRKDFPGGWPGDKINAVSGEGLSEEEKEMKEFFRTILTWRKEADVIHHGKMMHFVPENGVYVFFRYDNKDTVMVVLNKNSRDTDLDLTKFREILGTNSSGEDIISGTVFDLRSSVKIPAMSPLIIEVK